MNLLFRSATVIDPSLKLNARRDVFVRDGRVTSIESSSQAATAGNTRVIDCDGLLLAPGFIDLHVHLREPGNDAAETIATGSLAAARGGFTTVFCMPNTNPVCDSPVIVRYMLDRAREEGCGVRVLPVAAVTRGQTGEVMNDFSALWAKGRRCGAFSDDGRPVADAGVMRRAMMAIAELKRGEGGADGRGAVIFDHCEDMSLTGDGVMHEGRVSLRLGLKGIPRSSEATIVARDAALALETGCRLHICHVSNRDSVEAIRHYKSRGAPITAEVTPHHLLFTDELVAQGAPGRGPFDTHAKMKPPLCGEEDRQALIAALEDGTIDCIATDHAPHTPASKDTVFDAAPFGIIGMETAFPALYTGFVTSGRWTAEFLIDRLACAPARVMRPASGSPDPRVSPGTISPGAFADLVLIDPAASGLFTEADLGSRSRNCPWLGVPLKSRIVATLVAGSPAWLSADSRFDALRG